ncbi:MAG: hypothetical protein ACJ0OL_02445 [Dehalococcoidia bacterium]
MDIDLSGRIFLVTVGVNSRHGAIRSPVFPDRTFELMPKPEERSLWAPTLPAYPKIGSFNNSEEPLSNYVSSRYRNVRVMDDPEFQSFTYGGYIDDSQYKRKLMLCKPGDYIIFLSLLTQHDEKFSPQQRDYYIVGFIYVQKTLFSPSKFPDGEDFANFGKNAYIRRAVYHPKTLEGVRLWKGDPAMSMRLKHAVLFNMESILKPPFSSKKVSTKDGIRKTGGYLRYVQVPFAQDDNPEVFEKKIKLWNSIKNENPDLSL